MFGGTFDPPHVGHLIVAQDALAALGLDRIIFMPAAVPPHKRGLKVTPAETRLKLLRAATADDPRFEVSTLELRRAGPSYTVDTLRELRERDPEGALFFLMGADQFRLFHSWRAPDEIARLAELAVLTRDGQERFEPAVDVPHRWLSVTRVDISATELRRRVAAGLPIRYLVPRAVEELILAEGLYREAGQGGTGEGAASVEPEGGARGPSSSAKGTIIDSSS